MPFLSSMRKGVDTEYILKFGRHLAEVRKDKKITQEELSFKTEISLSQIARIETGKINPTLDTIVKLANGIGVEAKVLFEF